MKPSLIQCPSCSAEVPTESRFCLSCGEAISLSKIATVAPQHIPVSPPRVGRLSSDSILDFPVAFQTSAWYSSSGYGAIILIAGLALYGFRTSLGGNPVLDLSRVED